MTAGPFAMIADYDSLEECFTFDSPAGEVLYEFTPNEGVTKSLIILLTIETEVSDRHDSHESLKRAISTIF